MACKNLQEPGNWQMMFPIQARGSKARLGFSKNVYKFSHREIRSAVAGGAGMEG